MEGSVAAPRLQWPINLANSAHNLITICLTNLPAKTLSKSLSRKDRKVRSTHPFQYQRPIAKQMNRRPPANCIARYAFGQQVTVGVACCMLARGKGKALWYRFLAGLVCVKCNCGGNYHTYIHRLLCLVCWEPKCGKCRFCITACGCSDNSLSIHGECRVVSIEYS